MVIEAVFDQDRNVSAFLQDPVVVMQAILEDEPIADLLGKNYDDARRQAIRAQLRVRLVCASSIDCLGPVRSHIISMVWRAPEASSAPTRRPSMCCMSCVGADHRDAFWKTALDCFASCTYRP